MLPGLHQTITNFMDHHTQNDNKNRPWCFEQMPNCSKWMHLALISEFTNLTMGKFKAKRSV